MGKAGLMGRNVDTDGAYNTAVEKARQAHEKTHGEADRRLSAIEDAAVAAVTAVESEHRRLVDEAAGEAATAKRVANAELARASKAALLEWMAGERARLGVPQESFVARPDPSSLTVHPAPGAPALGRAWRQSDDMWVVDGPAGRQFIGGELPARRRLLELVVERQRQLESAELEM